MSRYRIRYRCALDAGCPVFSTIKRAYSKSHAERLFFDGCSMDGDEDWLIITIERVKGGER